MKKLLYSILILATVFAVYVYFSDNRLEEESEYQKKFLTPQEMKSQRIKHKLEFGEDEEEFEENEGKPDQPSAFVEYYNRIRTRTGESNPSYLPNYRVNELQKAKKKNILLKSKQVNLNWTERGPGNVSGRTRGLIIDEDDKTRNTWFVGSVGGGIWKTTNAGQSWTNLTPDFPTLSTVCLAQAKSNSKVIYAGTGEGFFNVDAIVGNGIFKTTDKGNTWTQLQSTAANSDFYYVNRLVISPENHNIVLAATNTSIQKSIDGGQTWKSVFDDLHRIQQIVARPDNFNTLFATANTSGILRSNDSGEHWNYVFNDSSGRIELAISPSQPNTMYALTESSDLYVSYDGGSSWAPGKIVTGSNDLFLSTQGWYNNALAVSPTNPDILIIGGVNIYKVEVIGTSSASTSVVNVNTENIDGFMSFVNFGGAYLSGGMDVMSDKTNYNTIEIQFGPGKKQKAHRFSVPNGATSGVAEKDHTYIDYIDVPFEVWDVGKNRQLMVSFRDQDRNGQFNLTKLDDNVSIGREYIWINDVDYKNTPSPQIEVNGGHVYQQIAFCWPVLTDGATWNPDNLPNSKIIINRSDVFQKNLKSTKVADWAAQGAPYVHADNHQVQFTKTNSNVLRIVVTNDGGVGYSDNLGISWTNPTNGYNCTQFYGVDKHPTENLYVGGLQDNGSWISSINPNNLSQWSEAGGGDGFDVVWNVGNPDKIITSQYYNGLYASYDQGKTWGYTSGTLTDEGVDYGPFITQIGYSVNDPDKLYVVGQSGVSYSDDFGKTWNLASIPDSLWGWTQNGLVEPSIANSNVVWAASQMSSKGKIFISKDAGKTFTAVNNYDVPMGALSGFATHPLKDSTAYALFSYADYPKILRTEDMGQTWEDISGFALNADNNGFPDVAVYSLLVMPHNLNEIWAGTEIGLFISDDNGKNWHYADNGLPAVSIWEMKVRGTQVVLATHGLGVWSVDIPELANTIKAPTLWAVGTKPNNSTVMQVTWGAAYDSVAAIIDNATKIWIKTSANTSNQETYVIDKNLDEGVHNLKLQAYINNSVLNSAVREFMVINYKQPEIEYVNSFDEATDDFIGGGFKIIKFSSLGQGMAIHTDHPYKDNKNISYYFKVPVIVQAVSRFIYHDIPCIEEGEEGSTFGSSNFYDYVIAEASKNGIDWIPLLDGYDFRQIKKKATILGKTVYSSPMATMFINHKISLNEKFVAGDTILLRFRLFSDTNTNGWGWVIDNVAIQPNSTSNQIKELNALNVIYPVPCNDVLHVKLDNDFEKQPQLTVYDLQGRIVQTYKSNTQTQIDINTTTFKEGVYILEIKSGSKVERQRFQVAR